MLFRHFSFPSWTSAYSLSPLSNFWGSFHIDLNEGRLVSIGGTDTTTGLPFEHTLAAIPGATMITPLTTVVTTLLNQGLTPQEAEQLVTTAFGIPESIDLHTFDPIEAIANGTPGSTDVLAAQTTVQNVIVQLSHLLTGVDSGTNKDNVQAAALAAIADQIQNNSAETDLTDPAQLETVLTTTITTLETADNSLDLSPAATRASQTAQVMAASNQKIADAATSGDAASTAIAIFEAKKVARSSTADNLAANTITELTTTFDVTNINDIIHGTSIEIDYSLTNTGDTDITDMEVKVVYSADETIGNVDDILIGTLPIETLNSDESQSAQESITLPDDLVGTLYNTVLSEVPSGAGNGYQSTHVDRIGLVVDGVDLTHGVSSDDVTYFPWDNDGNGTITSTDAIFVINRLGSTSSDANYNATADFNRDGTITPTDAISVINRLGYIANSNIANSSVVDS